MKLIIGLAMWFILEFILLIKIGAVIGIFASLLWLIGTAVYGVVQFKKKVRQDRSPIPVAFSSIAMVLLILPGYLSDMLGFLLSRSWVQNLLIAHLGQKILESILKRANKSGAAGTFQKQNYQEYRFGNMGSFNQSQKAANEESGRVIEGEVISVEQETKK